MSGQTLTLQHGRTVHVDMQHDDDLIEVRGPAGVLELRLKCTADGVVLQLEGTRISLRASESVDVECATFNVNANAAVNIGAAGDVRVRGKRIHLN